jgi:hypothetical protein
MDGWMHVARRAPRRRLLEYEFGGGGREQMRPCRVASVERGGQSRLGFGQAFPTTSADAQIPGEVAQTTRAAFDGGADLSV